VSIPADTIDRAGGRVPGYRHCLHPRGEVRWRVNAGGARYYVRQCLDCGASTGNLIASAAALAGGRKPQPFDLDAETRGREAADRAYAERAATRRHAFWDWYTDYLQSDAWRAKRTQALKRDKGLCQGCLDRPATQVHHLTYAHVGAELLFELISICDDCHERAHRIRGTAP